MNKVIVIAGPTATGKTALSVKLAKEIGGEIISADSVQIYKDLDIGSAKPTREEMGGIPHHMMDILSPTDTFSVADFCARAQTLIPEIIKRGKVPMVVGGTGLYISSLVDHVSFIEAETDFTVRNRLQEELDKIGKEAMHEKLAEIDADSARAIHPNNTKRVIRALEVFYTTGKTMTEQNAMSKMQKSPFDFVLCGLTCAREILYERINRRVDIMVESGLFDEVKCLLDWGVSPDSQSMQGIGYKEVVSYFLGEMSREESIDKIKQNSRNYAKRQLTWFRRGAYQWYDCTAPDLYEQFRRDIGAQII